LKNLAFNFNQLGLIATKRAFTAQVGKKVAELSWPKK